MIISEKQIMQLMQILYDSITSKIEIDGLFNATRETRIKLYNQITHQQSEELKDIK